MVTTRETYHDAHRIVALQASREELVKAATELLRVDDDWHGSINSEMSSARYSVRVALANAAKLAGKSIAELESRWVSVDDRLPEVKVGGMERVLVTDGRDVLTAEFYIKEQNLLERETTYEWCTHEPNVSCSMMAECIRFWMPYPSPPKR